MKPSKKALRYAKNYLRWKLGDRRGCKVLEGIDNDIRKEIIVECAIAFEDFKNDFRTR